MALIDALPKFRHKPLELDVPQTKLVEKSTRSEEPPITKIPVAKVSGETIPGEVVMPKIAPTIIRTPISSNGTNPAVSNRLVLPEAYSKLTPLAEAISDSTIVNPKARAALIAQVGLEKGWNWDPSKDFNFGNIIAGKSWSGATVERGDKDAKGNPIKQMFRKYNSPKEYLDDYLTLLKNRYPAAYAELHSNDFDIDRFTTGLIGDKFKYAINPKYKEEIKRVYEGVHSRLNTK